MGIDTIAAMGMKTAINAVRKTNPEGYKKFKIVIRSAGDALILLADALKNDEIDAKEIDEMLKKVRETGGGRLVIGLVMGALSKAE